MVATTLRPMQPASRVPHRLNGAAERGNETISDYTLIQCGSLRSPGAIIRLGAQRVVASDKPV